LEKARHWFVTLEGSFQGHLSSYLFSIGRAFLCSFPVRYQNTFILFAICHFDSGLLRLDIHLSLLFVQPPLLSSQFPGFVKAGTSDASGGVGFLLRVRLFFQHPHPPLMVLPAPVLAQVVLLLKVPCALDAVVRPQRWPVFVRNECPELGQLARVAEVAVHLVDVAAGGRGRVSNGSAGGSGAGAVETEFAA